MLSSATMQTKRILSWFSVLQSANNAKYAWDGEIHSGTYVSKITNIERGLTELLRK